MTVTAARLRAVARACKGTRVLVAGDLIADEFVYGRVSRVSRAPVLILDYDTADLVRAERVMRRTTPPRSGLA